MATKKDSKPARTKIHILTAGPGDHIEIPDGAEKIADSYDSVNRTITLIYAAAAPEGDPGTTKQEQLRQQNEISASGSNRSDGWEV